MTIYEPYGFTTTDNNIRYVMETYGIDVSNMHPDETLTLKEDEANRIDNLIKDQNFIAMFPYKAYGIKCKTVDKGEARPNYYVFIFRNKYISEYNDKHIRKEMELYTYNLEGVFKKWDNSIFGNGYSIWPSTLSTYGRGEGIRGTEGQPLIIFEMCKEIRNLKIERNEYKQKMAQMTRTVEEYMTKIEMFTEYMSKIEMLETNVATLAEVNHNQNMELSSLRTRMTALEPEPTTHETVKVGTLNRIFKMIKKNKDSD